MLSLSQCRRLLPHDSKLTDGELTTLREQLYTLAHAMTENAAARPQAAEAFDLIDSGIAELTAERAAIMEFDAGLDRDVAERAAFTGLISRRSH
jgi:hypothetical protein